jgi:hypothetical protein
MQTDKERLATKTRVEEEMVASYTREWPLE